MEQGKYKNGVGWGLVGIGAIGCGEDDRVGMT